MSGRRNQHRPEYPRHILNLVAESSGHIITSPQRTKHQPSLCYVRCWKAPERIFLAREWAGLPTPCASFRDGQMEGQRCEEIVLPGPEEYRALLSGECGVQGRLLH